MKTNIYNPVLMKHYSSNGNKAMVAVLILVLALTTSCFRSGSLNRDGKGETSQGDHKKEYVCSMHPDVIRDKPGDCPICGMALIDKVTAEKCAAKPEFNAVVIPVNESVLASVETVGVSTENLPVTIDAPGFINYDARNIKTVSANYGGMIEKSYIKYKFQPIRNGQKIYDIYCPDIFKTHMNYVNLLRKCADQPELIRDARNWMLNIGLTEQQIQKVIKEEKLDYHLSVYSKADGFVVSSSFNPDAYFLQESNLEGLEESVSSGDFGIGLKEGTVVEAGSPLFRVVNLNTVKADLKIKTQDAMLLKIGQAVTLIDAVCPGNRINTRISQIEPLNGGLFQVVRAYIPNPDKHLFPGMKIQAQIQAGEHSSLWIPYKAVSNLGQHQVVFLLKDKAFVATDIATGMRSGDKIEVCSGLDKGALIAANAALLTDSDGFIKTYSK